jgi:hypothetical protein
LGLYLIFGVDIGNLGFSGRRQDMSEWALEMNKKLASLQSSTKIVDWYGHTGNFVIESSKTERSEIASELTSVVGASLAVLSVDEVTDFVSHAEKTASPPPTEGKRWTCGIVFAVRSSSCQTVPKQTLHAAFFAISDYAVGAWKEDQLTRGGVLDRERRGGGWGAVSGDVSRHVGGVWTARSLRTVIGTIEKARQHTGQ